MSLINVPTEHVYFLERSNKPLNRKQLVERDPIKLNRFWFQYPPEWRTSSQSERIVGIRSLWISKAYRHLRYSFLFKKVSIADPTKITECELEINIWIIYTEDCRKLWYTLRGYIEACIKDHKDEWIKAGTPILDVRDFQMNFTYLYNDPDVSGTMSFCQKIYCTNRDPMCNCFFKVKDFNNDALYVFNIPDDYDSESWRTDLLFVDMWDRYPVLIESSLASNTLRNYIGFSDVRYNPVKYFKINSGETSFWVDLYMGHNHRIPAILPLDDKEAMILEMIVLDNANQLY